MLNYFRSSINRAADKRAGQVLTNKIHNEFSDVFSFSGIGCFEGTINLQVKDGRHHTRCPQDGSICTLGTPGKGARKITKATNNSASVYG